MPLPPFELHLPEYALVRLLLLVMQIGWVAFGGLERETTQTLFAAAARPGGAGAACARMLGNVVNERAISAGRCLLLLLLLNARLAVLAAWKLLLLLLRLGVVVSANLLAHQQWHSQRQNRTGTGHRRDEPAQQGRGRRLGMAGRALICADHIHYYYLL